MIDVENLVYDYPSGRALHGVSFVVRPGAVLALVGPNGAGKSTLMRCLAALDAPTEGRALVAGFDTQTHPREVHAAIGYLPDVFGLYDRLSVGHALIYAARSRGVDEREVESAVQSAAERVELSARLDSLVGTLSRGMRQRLGVAQAVVHRPRVLILDEPASGLDPEARHELSGLVRSLASDGMTLMVSSHILAELEDYCTAMLMLREGRVVGEGVVDAGSAAAATPDAPALTQVEVLLAEPHPALADRLSALGFAAEATAPDRAVLTLPPSPQAEAHALETLLAGGLRVRSFARVKGRLEDAYLAAVRSDATPAEESRP